MRKGDEGSGETWGRNIVYQCLGSNADGAALGALGGRKGRASDCLSRSRMLPRTSHPIPYRGARKGAAKPGGLEVPTPVPGAIPYSPQAALPQATRTARAGPFGACSDKLAGGKG